jgi:hypothetical protein
MKYIAFVTLMSISLFASANDNTPSATAPKPEQFNYTEHLDVAKVIKMTTDSATKNACGPVEAHMIYLDSKGAEHDMEYTLEGYACQNG